MPVIMFIGEPNADTEHGIGSQHRPGESEPGRALDQQVFLVVVEDRSEEPGIGLFGGRLVPGQVLTVGLAAAYKHHMVKRGPSAFERSSTLRSMATLGATVSAIVGFSR